MNANYEKIAALIREIWSGNRHLYTNYERFGMKKEKIGSNYEKIGSKKTIFIPHN